VYYCSANQFCAVVTEFGRGYLGGSPTTIQAFDPAICECGSHLIVTPWYQCTLGDFLCVFVFVSAYCVFLVFIFVFLQYFDTVGWVFWPVKLSRR